MANEIHAPTLGEVVSLVRGTTYKSALLGQPGPVLLGLASIQRNGGFRDDSLKTYGGASPAKLLLAPGDLFVSLKDVTQSADLLGAIARVPNSVASGRLTQDTVKLDFGNSDYPRDLLYWVLRTPQYRAYCRGHATGTTNLGLSREDFLAYRLPVPTNAVLSLVDTLGALDDKIELNRKRNDTLEAMARALFKAWFVDFEPVRAKLEGRWKCGQSLPGLPAHLYDLFPDRLADSELGDIPEGWGVGPLEELLVLQRGFDLPAQSRIEGEFPVIAAGGINGTHHKAMVKGPGVVTGRSGVLGNVFLELGDYWPLNTTLWVKEFRVAKPCYAYELLSRFDFKMFNAGSAVPTLNRNHIHVVSQIIPPSEVIGTFEDMAMVLHEDIVANNLESRSLAQLRDTLLPKLVSGELRIPDTEVGAAV